MKRYLTFLVSLFLSCRAFAALDGVSSIGGDGTGGGGDNLGDHIVTENLKMSTFAIEGDPVIQFIPCGSLVVSGAGDAGANGTYVKVLGEFSEYDDGLFPLPYYDGQVHVLSVWANTANSAYQIYANYTGLPENYPYALYNTNDLAVWPDPIYTILPVAFPPPVPYPNDCPVDVAAIADPGFSPGASPVPSSITANISTNLETPIIQFSSETLEGTWKVLNSADETVEIVNYETLESYVSSADISTNQITDLVFPDGADNLGDHTATQDLDMNGFSIISPSIPPLEFLDMDNLEGGETLPAGGVLTMTEFILDASPSGTPINYNVSGLTLDGTGVGNDSLDIRFIVTTDGGKILNTGRDNPSPFGWIVTESAWLNEVGEFTRLDFDSLSVNLNGGTANGFGQFLGFTALQIQSWDLTTEQALVNGVLKTQVADPNPQVIPNEDFLQLEFVAGTLPGTFRIQDYDFEVSILGGDALVISPGTGSALQTPYDAAQGDDIVNYDSAVAIYQAGLPNSVTPVDSGTASGTWIIDIRNGPVQLFTQTGPITDQAFVGYDLDNVESVEVILLTTTDPITWNAGIDWAEATIPTTTDSEYNRLIFSKYKTSIAGAYLGSTP